MIMEFKIWLENLEESTFGNLAALAGLAMGADGDKPQAKPVAPMVQQQNPRFYVTPATLAKMKTDAKKTIQNLTAFKRIMPSIFDEDGVLRNVSDTEEQETGEMEKDLTHPNQFRRENIKVQHRSIAQYTVLIDTLLESLNSFVSLPDAAILHVFNSKDVKNIDLMVDLNDEMKQSHLEILVPLAKSFEMAQKNANKNVKFIGWPGETEKGEAEEAREKYAYSYLPVIKALDTIANIYTDDATGQTKSMTKFDKVVDFIQRTIEKNKKRGTKLS